MDIKEQKQITLAEAKKILEEKEKQKELVYEQKNALEHLRKFSKLSHQKVEEMYSELEKIRKLSERHIVAIIDHLPEDPDYLRILLSGLDLSAEDKKKIIDAVKKLS